MRNRMIDIQHYFHPADNHSSFFLINYDDGNFYISLDLQPSDGQPDLLDFYGFRWEFTIETGYPHDSIVAVYLELGRFYCNYWFFGVLDDDFAHWYPNNAPPRLFDRDDDAYSIYADNLGRYYQALRYNRKPIDHRFRKLYANHVKWIKDAYREPTSEDHKAYVKNLFAFSDFMKSKP